MINRRTLNMDRPDLLLPDGRRADRLRQIELYRELDMLHVPGIKSSMGKLDLITAFEDAVLSKIPEAPKSRLAGVVPRAPSAEVLRLASSRFGT